MILILFHYKDPPYPPLCRVTEREWPGAEPKGGHGSPWLLNFVPNSPIALSLNTFSYNFQSFGYCASVYIILFCFSFR